MSSAQVKRSPLICYFDLETTSLDTNIAEIIEVASEVDPDCYAQIQLVQASSSSSNTSNHSDVAQSYASLVRPTADSIPEECSKINGIRIEDLKDKPSFKEIAAKFLQWAEHVRKAYYGSENGPFILVAHNCFRYDALVFLNECKRHEVQLPLCIRFGDSLPIFRTTLFYNPNNTSNDLDSLAKRFLGNDVPDQDHRAESDVRLLVAVIQKAAREEDRKQDFYSTLIKQSRGIKATS